jgi:hypothetical protein
MSSFKVPERPTGTAEALIAAMHFAQKPEGLRLKYALARHFGVRSEMPSDPSIPKLLDTYQKWLTTWFEVESLPIERHTNPTTLWDRIGHLMWMINECRVFEEHGNSYKAIRWIGFIEGSLVQLGLAPLADIQMTDVVSHMP